MNLKKLAVWSWKNSIFAFIFTYFCPNYEKNRFHYLKAGFFDTLTTRLTRGSLYTKSGIPGIWECRFLCGYAYAQTNQQ